MPPPTRKLPEFDGASGQRLHRNQATLSWCEDQRPSTTTCGRRQGILWLGTLRPAAGAGFPGGPGPTGLADGGDARLEAPQHRRLHFALKLQFALNPSGPSRSRCGRCQARRPWNGSGRWCWPAGRHCRAPPAGQCGPASREWCAPGHH